MKKLIFDTAKAQFKRAYRKYKAQKKAAKRDPNRVGVEPYDLIKADVKRKIRGTKFTSQAEIKATPGAKRRILLRIERSKREKKKFKKPVIFGKAYASDKAGKTMQIQPLTFAQRKLMKKEMGESAKRLYRKLFLSKKKKGGTMKFRYGGIKKKRT